MASSDQRILVRRNLIEPRDYSLWRRFQECRSQGLQGIPRAELLQYIEEAAEILDRLHTQHGLPRVDVKPQNLVLVMNRVNVVVTLGLNEDVQGGVRSLGPGITPVYASPETFECDISRHSDQYGLAIIYQEMLTGQRPFQGRNLQEIIMERFDGTPDLTPLPACEQAPIARALSKKPEDRFPTCTQLVQALRRANPIIP